MLTLNKNTAPQGSGLGATPLATTGTDSFRVRIDKHSAQRIGVATKETNLEVRIGDDPFGWALNRDGGLHHNKHNTANSKVQSLRKGDEVEVFLNRDTCELTFAINSMLLEYVFKDSRFATLELYPAVGFAGGEVITFIG